MIDLLKRFNIIICLVMGHIPVEQKGIFENNIDKGRFYIRKCKICGMKQKVFIEDDFGNIIKDKNETTDN